MDYKGVLLSDNEKAKYLDNGRSYSAVNRDDLIFLRTVFKGPENEIYRLLQYVEKEYQFKRIVDSVDEEIAVASFEIGSLDVIVNFPMLKVVGFVLIKNEQKLMYDVGVVYFPSGFIYPSKYEQLAEYTYDISSYYVYGDTFLIRQYFSKSYFWPILKDPCTNFTVRYRDVVGTQIVSDTQTQVNYIFPYAFEWNDKEYIYIDGEDYYRINKNVSFEIEGDVLKSFDGDISKIVMPKNVRIISDSVFKENNLINRVELPYVEQIGNEAFSSCTNLKYVDLGDSLRIIGDEAFAYCDHLIELKIPDEVSSIGDGAFFKCGMGKLTWPKGVKTIPMGIFRDCRKLYEIYIPPEVTTIEPRAFSRSNTVIVYGQSGSEAERYAKDNGMFFKPYNFG